MAVLIFILFFVLIWAISCFRIVHQNERAIVETFGRFSRTLTPGLNFIISPIQTIAHRLDMRILEYVAKVEVKTSDDAFVSIPVNIQYQVREGSEQNAYYKLANPDAQLKSWVLNALRAAVNETSLQQLFGDRHRLESAIQNDVGAQLADYGMVVIRVLIDQPLLSEDMQTAFNSVITSQRNLDAAKKLAEVVKEQAIGEAEAQRERAKGLADARQTLAEGLAKSAEVLAGKNISAELAMQVLVDTNRIDALRKIGESGHLIITDLSPHSANITNLATNIERTHKGN